MNQKKLGRYELTRVVGKGAMGLVYEGRDPNLDRRVAIKTIKVENQSSEEAAEYEIRFRTDARSAARLQHPNIVSVYDSDHDGGVAYLVMEFIEGEDLKHHLDTGERYTLRQAAAIMNDLLSALDYAHRQNIVHRDIKPANLLIEASGRIKLTDFGVARIQDSGEATRTRGTIVGTLKYMSPEQVHGLPIDARSDLFSAGIVLYQLLTGVRPFDGTGDFEIIQKIVAQPAEPPSAINPQLPPAIDQVVARALEKSRENRYPTAQAFNAALQTAAGLAADPTITPPKTPPRAAESTTWTSTVIKGESLVGTSPSSLPGSTVTQEVELVYWKEIKDSVDVEEFRDYLLKFPSGIYADLARRRIKRLTQPDGGHGGSQSGIHAQPPTAAPMSSGTSPSAPALKVAAAAPAPVNQDLEDTRAPMPRAGGTTVTASSSPAAPARGKRAWVLGGAGVALAAALVFGYLGLTPRTPVSEPALPAPVATTARADTSAKPAMASTEPDATPKATAAVPAPTRHKPPAEAKTASKEASADPRKECEGRVLLGYLTCLKEQCDKPNFAQHPVCVEHRAMEQRTQLNQ